MIPTTTRLLSLDVFRGFIMCLLAMESTGLYEHIQASVAPDSFFNNILNQFFHHPWHGLRFWDLIQPAFMFMAGISLAYSLTSQRDKGYTWTQSLYKTLRRCGWLFFWGVLDYAVRPGGLSFELWDVLTQLSFTTLIAFLIFYWKPWHQIIVCLILLLLTEILYRYTHIPDFDQPFVDQHNFGNWMDHILMNKINKGGWVAINIIPTAVHTIAGALAGKWLMDKKNLVFKDILIWAAICLGIGYIMDLAGITPIIKRIATTSFTLVSLGWCLLGLLFFYWWVDIKNHRRYTLFFIVLGMNSLFIYLFFEIIGSRWFNGYISAIATGVMNMFSASDHVSAIVGSMCIFGLEWGLCWWLWRKKIFFKL
ncbi:MAG: DUF5009 domain-containing protein [Saprospiraceae bacterium]